MLGRGLTWLVTTLTYDATIFEWFWTVPALIALVLRLWLLELVIGDVWYWRREHEREPQRDIEAERIWSSSQVFHKVVLALCLVSMAAFGMIAMFSPPIVQPAPPPTKVTYTLTVVFVLIPTLLTIDAIQTLINRRRTQQADDRRTANQQRRRTDLGHVEVIAEQMDKQTEGQA